ncbi:MAG TPA: zinc-binding alcohol dehydrogenase, partial [Candidatus Sulfotelmatobacter sp.]|nr:zinc-binding alcohol dehydrogenase [Candidatus Sulfotelmatobacter sp.]
AGAQLLIAVDPVASRRELATRLGADHALEPHQEIAAQIRGLTAGVGADVVVEASGAPSALDRAIESVAFQGTVVVSSWYGTKPVPLSLGGAFHRGRVRIVSSQVSSVDPALTPRWSLLRRREVAVDWLAKLPLPELITHRLCFDDASKAYRLIDERREEVVQVVLTYAQQDGSDGV